MTTKEWTPQEQDVAEHKYYTRGVNLVLVVEFKSVKVLFYLTIAD
ncbi:MAG: hypothetical protein ACFFCW_08545 [Candidatus Hodarchaeota archaeon]